jgi:ABC-type arginine/histidine transport system permease subunit
MLGDPWSCAQLDLDLNHPSHSAHIARTIIATQQSCEIDSASASGGGPTQYT